MSAPPPPPPPVTPFSSISSKFLGGRSYAATTARSQESQRKREELQRRIQETRRKLQGVSSLEFRSTVDDWGGGGEGALYSPVNQGTVLLSAPCCPLTHRDHNISISI